MVDRHIPRDASKFKQVHEWTDEREPTWYIEIIYGRTHPTHKRDKLFLDINLSEKKPMGIKLKSSRWHGSK